MYPALLQLLLCKLIKHEYSWNFLIRKKFDLNALQWIYCNISVLFVINVYTEFFVNWKKNNKIHVKSIILLYQLVHNLLECTIFIVFNVLENVGEFTKPALARHLCSHCESFLFWENPGAGCRRFDREIQKSSPTSDEANWSKKS